MGNYRQRFNYQNLESKKVLYSLAGRVWGMALTLLLTPVFIKYLGFEAYGLVGFFILVQSIMAILEFGMPLALNRAIARLRAFPNNFLIISKTIKSFEYLFIILSLLIIFLIGVPFSVYSISILGVNNLSQSLIKQTVFLIFFQAGIRLILSIYHATLTGFERIIELNKFTILFSSIRLGGAAIFLAFLDFNIAEFYLYQLFIVLIEVIYFRRLCWDYAELDKKILYNFKHIINESPFILTSFLISFLGVLLSQFDKAIITSKLPLESFGEYSLMVLFGSAIIVLGYPIGSVSFPVFSKFMALGNKEKIIDVFNSYLNLAAVMIFPISGFLFFFIEEFINYYIKSSVSNHLLEIFPIYLIGAMFASFVPLINGLILSSDNSRDTFWILLFLSVLYVPSLFFLINSFGLFGAAIGFLLIQLGIFLSYLIRCIFILGFRNLLPKFFLSYLLPGLITFFSFYLIETYIIEKIYKEKEIGIFVLFMIFIFVQSLVIFFNGKHIFKNFFKQI